MLEENERVGSLKTCSEVFIPKSRYLDVRHLQPGTLQSSIQRRPKVSLTIRRTTSIRSTPGHLRVNLQKSTPSSPRVLQ